MGKRKDDAADPIAGQAMNAFVALLVTALKHFHDPRWLGENSPLASAYFLGNELLSQPAADTATGRGRALQKLIELCLDQLEADEKSAKATQINDPSFTYSKLLRLRYVKRLSVDRVMHELHCGRTEVFRKQTPAFTALARRIIKKVAPALRSERPPLPTKLLEREAVLDRCINALAKGTAVAIAGAAGIGKTSLATVIAQHVNPGNIFWHTCAVGLGDNLTSFIFGLAHYLESRKIPDLWLYILSEWKEDQLRKAVLPGSVCVSIARKALNDLGTRLLICVDDIDLLKPHVREEHAQLESFLLLLKPDIQLLLIGSASAIADDTIELSALSMSAAQKLFEHELTTVQLDRLMQFTAGNPRFIRLLNSLQRLGEPLEVLLDPSHANRSLESIFRRIWQRTTEAQRVILAVLATSRKPVPMSVWLQDPDSQTVFGLIESKLIEETPSNGLAMFAAYREAVNTLLDEDERERAHLTAAQIFESYGEFTEAAYHFAQAHQPALALHMWNAHKTNQIEQGQTGAALKIFKSISVGQLSVSDQDLLYLLRAELSRIVGDYDYAERELARPSVGDNPKLAVRVLRERGDLYYLRQELDRALKLYRQALQISEQRWEALQQVVLTRTDLALALAHTDQKVFDEAWQQSEMARYEVAFLQGYILEMQQRFAECLPYYRTAVETAAHCNLLEGEAKARANLARVLSLLGPSEATLTEIDAHLMRAIQIYRQTGRANQIVWKLNDLAFAYNLAGRMAQSRDIAAQALEQARLLNRADGIAVSAQNLGEAELALGNLDAAEAASREVINTEERRYIPAALRLLGEIRLARVDLPMAEQLLRQSIHEAALNHDRYLESFAQQSLGRCLRKLGREKDARIAYDKAIELFDALSMAGESAKACHERDRNA